MATERFFKLCSRAPWMEMASPAKLSVEFSTRKLLPSTTRLAKRDCVECTAQKSRGLSSTCLAIESQPCLGKAALKTHALHTLARGPLTWRRAKRLECVRFIDPICPARRGQWLRVPRHDFAIVRALHEPGTVSDFAEHFY